MFFCVERTFKMAGFKCDICGGDIKMQANKTGVCQGCGMEYDLEAIRAMVGQQSAPTAPVQSAPAAPVAQTQDELDRESLLVYLNDVRIMETIISQDQNTLSKFDMKGNEYENKIKSLKIMPTAPKKPEYEKGLEACNTILSEKEKAKSMRRTSYVLMIIGILLILITSVTGSIANVVIGAVLFLIALCILCGSVLFHPTMMSEDEVYQNMDNWKKMKEEYDEKLSDYNNTTLPNARKNLSEAEKQKKEFNDKVDSEYSPVICKEIDDTKNALAKAYSANIIPQQFRNIEGVYYLYDYLSTSNQSLSEALMQANLEAIKQKLDDMIRLQSAQIVQQAQTNAKLDNIQAQNERLVQLSEATMNNTAVAAKYAQIAAVNSELNAKLAAESLAYQKAAFWLK